MVETTVMLPTVVGGLAAVALEAVGFDAVLLREVVADGDPEVDVLGLPVVGPAVGTGLVDDVRALEVPVALCGALDSEDADPESEDEDPVLTVWGEDPVADDGDDVHPDRPTTATPIRTAQKPAEG